MVTPNPNLMPRPTSVQVPQRPAAPEPQNAAPAMDPQQLVQLLQMLAPLLMMMSGAPGGMSHQVTPLPGEVAPPTAPQGALPAALMGGPGGP